MERVPGVRYLVWILTVIGFLWLAGWLWQLTSYVADILLIFFLAWLVAFVLAPVVSGLKQLRFPHTAAVLLVYLDLLLVIVIAGILIVPPLTVQLIQLGTSLPAYAQQVPDVIPVIEERLRGLGLIIDLRSVYRQDTLIQQVSSYGKDLVQNSVGVVSGILSTLFNIILILILSLYIMMDGPRLQEQIIRLIPESWHDEMRFFMESVGRTFGGFLRGQLIQGLVYGLGTAVIMVGAGLEFVLVVSIFSGLIMLIPFLGPFLAIIPAVVIAAFHSPATVVIVLVALFILQQLVMNVLAPKIMSESLGMHPLLIFAATLIGVRIAGFWGALFGVPVAGVIQAMGQFFLERRNRQPTPVVAAPRPGKKPARPDSSQ